MTVSGGEGGRGGGGPGGGGPGVVTELLVGNESAVVSTTLSGNGRVLVSVL